MKASSDIGYPDAPGFKAHGPSEDAATMMAATARSLRERVLATIAASAAGLTADEVAAQLNKSILSVRPRVAELHRQGEIRPAVNRGTNASGMTASIWVVSPPLPASEGQS
ncbi:hypothetical protein [Bradyrhizobium sp. CCBAU 45394]|uniref:hypothetical protein n=1 Tax=Bradyrhizobium sp. CCBAU 45394 TaxID=1325087 RepID=UPI00230206BC|nr:hypothetical protein [Bradyrhizobium sp. CCBAU 45394]